jgi:hypothetical protein
MNGAPRGMNGSRPMAIQIPVPATVSSMGLLDSCRYEDAFSAVAPGGRSPGEWARLILDGAPGPLLWGVRFAQGPLLGLHLQREDAEHPLGWTIVREDEDAVVLAAEGPGGAARIIGTAPAGRVIIATQTRFERRRSRLLWAFLAPVHRRVSRYLLDRAVDKALQG